MRKSVLMFLAAIFALSLSSCGTPAAEVQTETVTSETAQSTTAEAVKSLSVRTAAETTETKTTTTAAETTSAETTTTTEEPTTTITETEKVCTCESEFQHACCEYLNNGEFPVNGIFYGDINNDDKPETVISINPFGYTHILYETENGVRILELETVSAWGTVRYFPDTKQILFCPMAGHTTGTWGYEEYYIYDWDGSNYDISTSIFRESGNVYRDENGEKCYELGQAYIDGKEVDNNTFEVKLAEMQKLRDENDYFPVVKPDDENFKSYMKENFPCFDNWDMLYY